MSKKLFKSTAIVSAMTLPSRLLGYVRDMVIAVTFGATASTDAFFVAFRIPNLLRRMFAEGAFAQAFVPVFTEYKENKAPSDVRDLADHTAGVLLVILSIITVLGVLASPLIIMLFAPGFGDDPVKADLASQMLQLTFPYVLFISLTALAGGILNSYGKFAVPAFTPVFLNISLIACAIWLSPEMEEPVKALAWGVFIAGIVQLVFQLPALYKIGLIPRPKLRRGHEGVRRIGKLILPALFGSSVAQLNMLLNTMLASFLVAGSISWLYMSDRFVELPLALFGIAISTVVLPKLSADHANQSMASFTQTVDWALRLGILIALPAMMGLILLAGPILSTLLQYNAFTAHDVAMASISLAVYAIGLPGFVLVKILAPGFYARQDTVTPVKIGIIAMLTNIALYAIIVLPWILLKWPAPHAALAFCTAAAAGVNASLLLIKLKKAGIYQPVPGWWKFLVSITIALIAMSVVLYWATPELENWRHWGIMDRVTRLTGLILLGSITYLVTLIFFKLNPSKIMKHDA